MNVTLIPSPVWDGAVRVWEAARTDLLIVSPWLKRDALVEIKSHVSLPIERWKVLSLGQIGDFLLGASDIDAFSFLVDQGADVRVVTGLHAKVYVADDAMALFGSANLTQSGMHRNVEIAAISSDPSLVQSLAEMARGWHLRGRRIDSCWLEEMSSRIAASIDPPGTSLRAPDLEGPDIGVLSARPPDPDAEDSIEGRVSGYLELPLPEEWKPALESLLHCPISVPLLEVPEEIDRGLKSVLATLRERERFVITERLGSGRTLEEIGLLPSIGLTRERIRQIEAGTLRRLIDVINQAPQMFLEPMSRWLRLDQRPVFRGLSVGDSALDGLRVAVGLLSRAIEIDLDLRAAGGHWVIARTDDLARLEAALGDRMREPRFAPRATLALEVGVSEEILDILASTHEARLTSLRGCYGWRWTKQDQMLAIARQLAAAGFADWHLSELARALEYVNAPAFEGFAAHDVGSILGRDATKNTYENTGRAGRWRLQEEGDGFRSTFDAVVALLHAAPCPVHFADIHSSLRRPVSEEALYL